MIIVSQKKNERILWIDFAKAIGIFLVVVGHGYYPCEGFNFFSKNFIYSFHMPIFFFISGFLFRIKDENFILFLKKNVKSLIVPYILLNILAFVLFTPLLVYNGTSGKEHFMEMFFDFVVGGGHSFAGASWFLLAIFWIRLASYFAVKYKKIIVMTIISVIVAYVTMKVLYFDLASAAAALPIFIAGYYAKKSKILMFIEKYSVRILILTFATLCLACHFMGEVSIYSLTFGNYPYVFYPYILLGGAFFLSFCVCIAKSESRVTLNMSRGSIIIMCIHGAVSVYVGIFLTKFEIFHMPVDTLMFSIISSLITMALIYNPMIYMMNKFPILTGGR